MYHVFAEIHGGEKNGGATTSGISRAVVIILGILGAIASAGTNLLVRRDRDGILSYGRSDHRELHCDLRIAKNANVGITSDNS